MALLDELCARRDEILTIAARHGVRSVRVIGSVARGEDRPDSDIDFLVATGLAVSAWFPGGLVVELQDLLGRRVEVATEAGLRPGLREDVLAEAVYL